MVMIGLRRIPAHSARLNRAFRHITDVVEDFHNHAIAVGMRFWEREIKSTFSLEGFPTAWKALAPWTAWEREQLGFKPAHPILKRQGLLMEGLWNPELWPAIRDVAALDVWGKPSTVPMWTGFTSAVITFEKGHTLFLAGTVDERFFALQEGLGGIPARPMVPSTVSAKRIFGYRLERYLVKLLDQKAIP